MKFSMFNITTKDRKGNLLLVNPLSNSFFRISVPHCHSEEELANALYNSDYQEGMISTGVLVEDSVDYRTIINKMYDNFVVCRDRLDIVILTTNACNFECVYCFQHKNKCRLSTSQYDVILKFIEDRADQYRNVRIRWFGGEPLLELKEICLFSEKLKKVCRDHKMSFGASMTTNGYLLDYSTFEQLYDCNVLSYQISLDGTPDSHNMTRPLKGGGESYERIIDNLKEIHKRAPYKMFNIVVRVNFTKELLEKVNALADYFRDTFEEDERFIFSFIPIFNWSNTEEDQDKAKCISGHLTSRQAVYEAMKDNAEILRFNVWTELLLGNNNCWAGTKHGFAINGDGTILKCDFKLEGFEDNIVGRINSKGYEFYSDKNKMWDFPKPLEECYHCKYFPLCLSTMCGASRVENCMESKCRLQKEFVDNCLEIESYSKYNRFKDVIL